MDKKELQDRLKRHAIAIVRFSEELPEKSGFRTVRNQIVRCAPSSTPTIVLHAGRNRQPTTSTKWEL